VPYPKGKKPELVTYTILNIGDFSAGPKKSSKIAKKVNDDLRIGFIASGFVDKSIFKISI